MQLEFEMLFCIPRLGQFSNDPTTSGVLQLLGNGVYA